MHIAIDDPARPDVRALLEEHLRNMYALSPPESVHALDVSSLKRPGITFWTAREGETLLGCGALKELDPLHGEIKSMRTPEVLRRRGAGRAILAHIIATARERGYARLSLETGSMEEFVPAQKLYESFGFTYCTPFPPYVPDPNSVFMTLSLPNQPHRITLTEVLPDVTAYHELFVTTGWNEEYHASPDDLDRALRNSWLTVSAYDGDVLVGFGRVVTDHVMHAMIYDMIVLPARQGQGIGAMILKRVVDRCHEHGIKDIQLFCAKGKRGFYEKNGFIARPDDAPGMQLRSAPGR